MKLYYAFLAVFSILGFSIMTAAAQPILPAPQATKPEQKLTDFNTISVRGPIELVLEHLPEGESNFLQIPGSQNSPISFSVKDNTLYLEASEATQLTTAKVGVSQLNQLIVDGNASVTSKQFTSPSLSIDANTTGSINLLGMITLDRVLSSGKGPINIQWIDSPRLRIDGSNQSQIQLAGVASSVEMRLRDESQFEGKYLRIDRIYIQTRDFANAKILVNESLRAFAYDHSNIYYYKKPVELTEFTAGAGNIVQLGWGP